MIKFGICWLHRCAYTREKQVLTDHESITLYGKTQCPVHLTFVKVETCRIVLTQKSGQDTISHKEGVSSGHQTVQGKGDTFVTFSNPEDAARLVLEEQRDHQLAEPKSELLKQECEVDVLNTCIREFQRKAHSNRLEMESKNYGYEESQREQARLQE